MESIRSTTQKLIKDLSTQGQGKRDDTMIKSSLRRIFSKQEQRHITRYFCQDKRMIINVDSSAWLYQLNLKKGQFVRYLNQVFTPGSEQAITEVVLRLDNNEAKD
ncbi:MAG: DciA family protein [Candidatus Omnitrophota bacterium]|jgi:hypothetical protein